jgi:two-component system sensor histidine kinase PilS (NtrC family)
VYASTIIGGQAGIVLAITCSAMYAALGVFECLGLLPAEVIVGPEHYGDPLYVGYLVIVRSTIFCILGYLVDYLANTLYRSRMELEHLKKLNERILAEMKSGLFTTDPYGTIIFANAAAEEILGYRRREMMGKSWHAFLGRAVDDINDQWLADEARSFTRCEIKVKRKDGREIPIGFTLSNLLDRAGTPLGLLILFRDLTPIYRMEERMRRTDRLSAAGAVLASVAHEVRTPLASIRGAVEVLREGAADKSTRGKMMDVVVKESDRLNRIVSDFLSYGRAHHDERTREDLSRIMDEVLQLTRNRRGASGVAIVRGDGASPVYAPVDGSRIKQVFINIIDNAMDALRGQGTVTVSIERMGQPDGGPVARIRITDTGEGMSAERMSHLFEPFYSTKESGTGMGLFIAEGIVRSHGGQLEVESTVGKGTTFIISLPCEPGGAPAMG